MKNILILIIYFLLIKNNIQAQIECFSAKSILINYGLEAIYMDKNSNITLYKYDQTQSTVFNTNANGSAAYSKNPICWDLSDSILYQISLHDDGPGMTYSDLSYYNLNNIFNVVNKQDSKVYLNSNTDQTSISKKLPLYDYMLRIRYRDDTLHGPLFFDFQIKEDSINLYIYIQDSKMVEIWRHAELHLLKQNQSVQQRNTLTWVRSAAIPANISAPFRVVHTRGRDYLITTAGDILRIGTKALEPAGKLPALTGKGILVIDKGKDAVYFMEEKWMEEAQKRPLEEIISKEAIRILKEK
jgi:hypothetical protein